MKRRNFIKNAGLSLAGLAISNSIYSKNLPAKKSLNIIILMSGGIDFNDIIDDNNNRISVLFNEHSNLELICKTRLNCSCKNLEHANAVINALHELKGNSSENIFISNTYSDVTKTIMESKLPLTVVTTNAQPSIKPYRNDAAIFKKASQYLNSPNNCTLILNLEDTDIAHFNKQKYYDVLQHYNHQIDLLCKKVYSPDFRNECHTSVSVTSVIGRNNFSNDVYNEIDLSSTDHYDESARKLFSFDIAYAAEHQLKFDHTIYDSKHLLNTSNGFNPMSI